MPGKETGFGRSFLAALAATLLVATGIVALSQPAQATGLTPVTSMCRSTGSGSAAETSLTSNGHFLDATSKLRITPIFSKQMYIDGSRNFNATYIGYRITNTQSGGAAKTFTNTSIELTGFTASSVITPVSNEDSSRQLGTLAPGATKNVYFLMRASGPTTAAQRHDVRIYTNKGTATEAQEAACYTEIQGVKRSISASANKVTSIQVTGSPQLGETLVVTVKGAPGGVGKPSTPDGSIMALSPASNSSWPTAALRLESVKLEVFGLGNTSVGSACRLGTDDGYGVDGTVSGSGKNTVFTVLDRLIIRNFDKCATTVKQTYQAEYTFRVIGRSGTNPAIVPLASISSGTQVKYTGTLPAGTTTVPLTSTTYPINVNKSFVSSTKVGETHVDVTYRITATTSSATSIIFEDFRDEPDALADFRSGIFTDETRTSAAVTRTNLTIDSKTIWRFRPSTGTETISAKTGKNAILEYVVRYPVPTTDTTFRNLGYIVRQNVSIGSSGLTTGIDALITPSGDVTPSTVTAKVPQQITFDAPKFMGANNTTTLTADASSGLPVSFSAGPDSICGVKLQNGVWTLFTLSTGNCVVTASQVGDDTFEAASPVSRTIQVLPGQVITEVAGAFGATTATVEVSATSKREVSLESLDEGVCTVSQSIAYNSTTGVKVYTVTKATVDGKQVVSGNCRMVANQVGNQIEADGPLWGPAPEKLIQIGFGTAQFLRFINSNPNEPTSPTAGFAETTKDFTVTFTSVTTNGGAIRTGLPVEVASLTPLVCSVELAVVDGEFSSGYNSTSKDTTVKIVRNSAGKCLLEASQEGVDDAGVTSVYAPATKITKDFILLSKGTDPQNINFDSITGKTYGGDSFFAFVASTNADTGADTTLLVNISSQTPLVCVVGSSSRDGTKSKAEVFIVGAGTCQLSGDQPGNDDYKLGNGSTSFVVAKKQLTIAGISSVTREYDGTRDTAISGTATLAGVVPGDGSSDIQLSGNPLIPKLSSEYVGEESLQLGGYTLSGNKAFDSYQLVQPSLTFTVTTRAITLKFADLEANPTPQKTAANCLANVSPSLGSFAVGDSLSAVSCNFPSYDAASGYPAGTSAITPNSATISGPSSSNRTTNYVITYAPGDFVVSSKDIPDLEAPELIVVYGNLEASLETIADASETSNRVKARHNGNLITGSVAHKLKNGNAVPNNLEVGVHEVDVEFNPTNSAKYSKKTETRTIRVLPRKLTISGISAQSKTYDGNRNVTFSGTGSLIADPEAGTQGQAVLDGDDVTLSGSVGGELSSSTVGTRTVSVTGIGLNGVRKGNYELRLPTYSVSVDKRNLKIRPSATSYSVLRSNLGSLGSFDWELAGGTSFADGEGEDQIGSVVVQREAGNTASTTGYRVFVTVGNGPGKGNYDISLEESLLYIADGSIDVTETDGKVSSDEVQCACEGFKPGSTAVLTMKSDPTVLATAPVEADGTCPLLKGTLPAGSQDSHNLELTGIFPSGKDILLTRPITFPPAATPSDPPGQNPPASGNNTPTPSASPTPTPSLSPTPRPLPTIGPVTPAPRPTPAPSVAPSALPSPSPSSEPPVARGPEVTYNPPVITGPIALPPPALPGALPPAASGGSVPITVDYGDGVVVASGSGAQASQQLGVRSVDELAAEKMGGFAPGAGLTVEVLGARTGARFVLADLDNLDSLVILRAIENSMPAQSADFSQLTSVTRSEQPTELSSWDSDFRSGADRFFEAVGLDKPIGLYELDLSRVKNWLKVEARIQTYQPGSTVFLVATSQPIVIGVAQVDQFGNAQLAGDLPLEALGQGEHRIRVVGTRSLRGVQVDANGEVQLDESVMAEIRRFDLGTQSTVAISGPNSDGGVHSAIRIVPLVPEAPWWTLWILGAVFLLVASFRLRSPKKSNPVKAGSALTVLLAAIPAIVLGWISTVTDVTWFGLAIGVVLALVAATLPAKKPVPAKSRRK